MNKKQKRHSKTVTIKFWFMCNWKRFFFICHSSPFYYQKCHSDSETLTLFIHLEHFINLYRFSFQCFSLHTLLIEIIVQINCEFIERLFTKKFEYDKKCSPASFESFKCVYNSVEKEIIRFNWMTTEVASCSSDLKKMIWLNLKLRRLVC